MEEQDTSVDRFIENHKDLECDLETFRSFYDNPRSLHNHTFENLLLYFSLEKYIQKKKVHFYPGLVFFNDRRRFKWFINAENFKFSEFFELSQFSEAVRNKMAIYSSHELEDDFLIKTKFKETVYCLSDIFDEEVYYKKYERLSRSEIKKKIYNRTVYPFRFLDRFEGFRVEEITEDILPEVGVLHKDWCEYKLNDPKTFKMMFSTNRYLRCLQESFRSSLLRDSKWYRKAFYIGNLLVAVRQCLIVDDTSYDIGFFSRFWDCPSNMMNYINTYCMKDLMTMGVRYHNCGNELDKHLKRFKEHFPFEERVGYKYNFKK